MRQNEDRGGNSTRNAEIVAAYNAESEVSMQDLADRFGVSRSTVCGVLFRAREKGRVSRRRAPPRQRRSASREVTEQRRTRRAEAIKAATWQPMTATASLEMADAVVQLKFEQCRFPIDGEGEQFHFCPDKAVDGSPYCPFHHDLTHRRASDVES